MRHMWFRMQGLQRGEVLGLVKEPTAAHVALHVEHEEGVVEARAQQRPAPLTIPLLHAYAPPLWMTSALNNGSLLDRVGLLRGGAYLPQARTRRGSLTGPCIHR